MKVARLKAFGVPWEGVEVIDGPDVGEPDAGEVVVAMEASPINPADLLFMEGRYATLPPLQVPLGIEGAGRIVATGPDVGDLAVGDPVMSLGRANWAARVRLKAAEVVKLPADVDIRQAAMLKVNPATALLMLRSPVALEPGDWVIQNAANSGVGRDLIRLAKTMGVRTVNVVRRANLVPELKALGADAVVVDGTELADVVRNETGAAAIRLGIDAVAGDATRRLSGCLADGATLLNYGLLSGDPCRMDPHDLVFRGVTLTGFWLAKGLQGMALADIRALYGELVEHLTAGDLTVPIEATYRLDDVAEALAHAAREARDGKVILMPSAE